MNLFHIQILATLTKSCDDVTETDGQNAAGGNNVPMLQRKRCV